MRKKEDIKPRNEHNQKHGLWISYYNNGNIRFKQRWFNGELHGIYESYWSCGKLYYKDYYINDKYFYSEWYTINKIEFNI